MSDFEFSIHLLFLIVGLAAGLTTLILVASEYGSKLHIRIRVGLWFLGVSTTGSAIPATHQLFAPRDWPIGPYDHLHLLFCSFVYLLIFLWSTSTLMHYYKSKETAYTLSRFWREELSLMRRKSEQEESCVSGR